jgi:galactonate dehydratase
VKVTGVETFVVANPPPSFGGRYFTFVKLTTSDGIVGYGEAYAGTFHPDVVSRMAVDLADRHLVGHDPFDIERFWRSAHGRGFTLRPDVSLMGVVSALEMACWDIVGKAVGQPVYNLLGGRFHEKLRAYAYMPTEGIWDDPEKAGQIAKDLLTKGNTACKFDPFTPFFPLPRDFALKTIRRVARIFQCIRDAVGDELEVALGTHGQLATHTAIRVAKVLEEYDPFWFEEPVPPENVDEMARVAAHTSIPIATGERLLTKYEFVKVLAKQAAQIIQLDVGHCGGILESKKIAGMAEAHYAMVAPHMYCGPVAAAAAIQLATCSPNFLIQEYNATPFHDALVVEPLCFENGYITPPSKAGLGVELDMDMVREHPYRTAT